MLLLAQWQAPLVRVSLEVVLIQACVVAAAWFAAYRLVQSRMLALMGEH